MTGTALNTISPEDLAGFLVALTQACESSELLEEYDRLYGTSFRTGHDILAKVEAGSPEPEVDAFVAFVRDHVWQRISPQVHTAVCDRAIAAMAS